jgi:DNA (cytosine-5)-methyltransferase 1
MGLPESYALPETYNETYHLLGDGVVAPVVRHLAEHWMAPLLGRA